MSETFVRNTSWSKATIEILTHCVNVFGNIHQKPVTGNSHHPIPIRGGVYGD
ncbi:MAG: hypothetical protein R3281_18850 [Balneolaceae bacterium]|nr:hypothetical protein [Balneolaceae bacterium]